MKPHGAVRLKSRIIGVAEPLRQCAIHHRHLRRCMGGLVGVEVVRLDTGWPCAWGIVGRPLSRYLQSDGWVELVRGIVPDGAPPGCASAIIAAAARWARADGRPAILSYTLEHEPGTSYRAAGWVQVGWVRGRQWACPSRAREERGGLIAGRKRRWVPPWALPAALARGWAALD